MLNINALNLVDDCSQQAVSDIHLKSITIYPVKSCQGFSVQSWPLAAGGLKYDREWLLQGSGGEILTQKKVPELSSIHTLIDLELGKLLIESPKCKHKLQISLLEHLTHLSAELDVYGQRYGHGKILFGLLLNYEDGMDGEDDTVVERWLQVGQEVYPYTE
ncbi:hypothetical protein PR202_ga14655 [Eleusine coracana subsp. coracana]|uniref:Molybdenum cofactor sulfurase middle domain-containing protein n=1 Tax=Eleusine coracana subsp. coracana TaxID=191504 RepID=A0AAV5CHU6_ELECO|nr:hypothetical protein PR202_ga14655 [Eleusine coracana subsp. coracana]